MERARLEEFVASAALLAAHLTRQCEESIAAQRSAADELRRSADALGQRILGDNAELQQQARSAIRQALSGEIPAAARVLHDTSAQLQSMAQQLRREQAEVSLRMRALGWKTLVSLTLAAVVLVGASAYAAWHNLRRAEQAHVRAEVLQALQHVAVTSCDGHPCLRLEEGMPRWSKNEEYVLVRREAAATGLETNAP